MVTAAVRGEGFAPVSISSTLVGAVLGLVLLTSMLALCAKKKQRLPPPKTVPLSTVVSQGNTTATPHTTPHTNTNTNTNTDTNTGSDTGTNTGTADQTPVSAPHEEPLPPIPVEKDGGSEQEKLPDNEDVTYMQTYSFSSIKRDIYEEKMQKMKQRQGFFSEFDRIETEEEKFPPALTASTAADAAGTVKNRYTNIIAKDWSRVRLKDGKGEDDYINANYIHGYKQKKAYIAAQAPTEACLGDFWAMLWQENVRVIVMVAQLMEGTSEKCTRYWPQHQGEEVEHGDFKIKYIRDEDIQDESYTRRLLEVTNQEGETRTLWHLHYESWPDHGIPGTEDTIYSVVRDMNAYKATQDPTPDDTSSEAPVVVHCSAGVGRSGVMICLDIAIKQMEADGMADIYNIVLDMRKHRAGMVQRSKQYEYCYEAVLEYIKRKEKEKTANTTTVTHTEAENHSAVQMQVTDDSTEDGSTTKDDEQSGEAVAIDTSQGTDLEKENMKMEACLD